MKRIRAQHGGWRERFGLARLLTAIALAPALLCGLAPAAWAACQSGRVYVVREPAAQLFTLGNAERRTIWYLSDTFAAPDWTCGLAAVSKMPGVILHGSAGEVGSVVLLNSIDLISDPPSWSSLTIEVTSSTPAGDGVIEFRNRAGGVDGTGASPESLVVGLVRVHINQPAVIVGDLVGTSAFIDSADVGGRTFATTAPGLWRCPAGYQLAGFWRYTDGFWLCARADLAGRGFWFGDAERTGRKYFKVQGGGAATYGGTRGWDACDGGSWLSRHADGTGWWICMEGALPDVLVGDARHFTTPLYAVYGGGSTTDRAYYYGTEDWNWCPWGYSPIGSEVHENGFWLCARNDLAARGFWVGDVEDGIGYYYRVTRGSVSFAGTTRPWNTCDGGTVPVGRRTAANGFWVCIDAPRGGRTGGF